MFRSVLSRRVFANCNNTHWLVMQSAHLHERATAGGVLFSKVVVLVVKVKVNVKVERAREEISLQSFLSLLGATHTNTN